MSMITVMKNLTWIPFQPVNPKVFFSHSNHEKLNNQETQTVKKSVLKELSKCENS